MSSGKTPLDEKTKYGQISDYNSAKRELDRRDWAQLVNDVSEYEEDPDTARELREALEEDNAEKYNRNQFKIREVAKEKVTKESQPEWAWKILSAQSPDFGRLLDIPSKGYHKGLMVDENFENAFLYPKRADGETAREHVETWYENAQNAKSIGYQLTSEEIERTAIKIGDTEEAVLMMDYNSDMVLDSKIDEFLEENQDLDEEEIQDIGNWLSDSQRDRKGYLEEKGLKESNSPKANIEDWRVGLELLIQNNMFESEGGTYDYRQGNENTAINRKTLNRILVDLGEIRQEEDEEFDFRPRTTGGTNQDIAPNGGGKGGSNTNSFAY